MVNYINYKGEQLPVKFAFSALRGFQNETKRSPDTIGDSLDDYVILLYHSLIAGHREENKELKLSKEDMPFVLDDVFEDFVKAMRSDASKEEGDPTKKKNL